MNFKRRFLFLNFLMLLLINPAFSQVNPFLSQNLSKVNIDDVPDEEISTYYLKAKENGWSDQDIYRALQQKGLPEEEIAKLQERISTLNIVTPSKPETDKEPTD